jgi:hypothetical protein
MVAQKSAKPAAAETADGLQNIDRLGGTIYFRIIRSKTQRQIRKRFDAYRLLRAQLYARGCK